MSQEVSHSMELQQAEERFRLVVESSPAAVVIVDHAGRIVLVNQQTERWFGFEREELLGKFVEILVPQRFLDRHVDDRNRFLKSPQARPMGAGHELFGIRRDGSEIPIDISLHPMETDTGPLVMAYIVDLRDRKQAELETQKRHSMQRLALLGQLAGGVAHEIRNPLGVIKNAAYYLQMIKETLDEDARESVAEILEEVERANRIVCELLDFARDAPQKPVGFELVPLLQKYVSTRCAIGTESVELRYSNASLKVMADEGQVLRILQNLILNSAQASQNQGTIRVFVREVGKQVEIDVVDQGEGVPQELRARIFEPLYTSKTKGIGLGLAVSKRYAERNGGSLELVGHTGSSTIFRLSLPKSLGPE